MDAEAEIGAAPPRSLSMVRVSATGADLVAAVRSALRSTDTVGRGPDGSLVVLLPDVDETGAAAVAARVARAVHAHEPGARADAVTRRSAEQPVDLLMRAVPDATRDRG
jgi:hypothetical protein